MLRVDYPTVLLITVIRIKDDVVNVYFPSFNIDYDDINNDPILLYD